MQTQTAQPLDKQHAGQILYRATRFLTAPAPSYRPDGSVQQLPGDVALDTRWLGRDLVREVFRGRTAEATDGKYVDVVTETGRKLRVFTRVVTRRTNNALVALAGSSEISPINFATDGDKPDSVVLVAVNTQRNTVDVFDFPLEVQGGKKVTRENLAVSWSTKKQNYGIHQTKLTYSFSIKTTK